MLPYQVVRAVRLTEKANHLSAEFGQYTFDVDPRATKLDIKLAIEQTFKVKVTRVNVQNYLGRAVRARSGRTGFRSDYKKALVTLKAGEKIELV